jgi:hypothetical protein
VGGRRLLGPNSKKRDDDGDDEWVDSVVEWLHFIQLCADLLENFNARQLKRRYILSLEASKANCYLNESSTQAPRSHHQRVLTCERSQAINEKALL